MEEIYKLQTFFPLVIDDTKVKDYLSHHLSHLQKCYENKLYSSAYPHLHILYMTFVYFQLLRIAKEKENEFKFCWIGLSSEEKEFLNKPTYPFSFSKVKEKSVFRFFRLIDFDDGTIGDLSSLVNDRNKTLHSTGDIFCANEDEFIKKYNDYLRKMTDIIHKQNIFLTGIYQSIIDTFELDYKPDNDDVSLSFGSFSEFELKLLAENKFDQISVFIVENY